MLSHVGFFATLWTVDHQAPLSMGFSRQERWSGLLFQLLQGIFPEPASSALAAKFFTTVTSESESHSVVSDSVRPHRRQPTRLLHPWDFPGKNAGVGCHFLLQCMKVKSESEVA